MEEMQEVIKEMKTFQKYFSHVRLINPLCKTTFQVVEVDGCEVLKERQHTTCYDFWGIHESCANCISMRAVNEGDTFVKLEEVGERVFMITAMPVEREGRFLAIELIKDITNQKILDGMLNADVQSTDIFQLRHSIARLNDMVTKDALTKVYNRQYINEKLPVNMIQAAVEEAPLSIVMADIDYFKKVNDTYGHVAGDEILESFAQTLQANIRQEQGDWIARYGGEEFLIFLANCDKGAAWQAAERIRRSVEAKRYVTSAGEVAITASFGIQTIVKQEMDMLELIRLADENLYAAKRAGRNRVVAD